jgi:hypothetical protein
MQSKILMTGPNEIQCSPNKQKEFSFLFFWFSGMNQKKKDQD